MKEYDVILSSQQFEQYPEMFEFAKALFWQMNEGVELPLSWWVKMEWGNVISVSIPEVAISNNQFIK